MKKMILCVVVLLAIGNVMAATPYWVGSAAGGDNVHWNDAGNWTADGATPGPVPGIADDAKVINVPGSGATIANPGAAANFVDVGTWGWDGDLAVTAGGTLSVGLNLTTGGDAGFYGDISNSGLIDVGNMLYLGSNGNSTVTNSGVINVVDTVMVGEMSSSTAVLTNTGAMTIGGWMYLAYDGARYLKYGWRND